MSIVENLRNRRIFAAFLLLTTLSAPAASGTDDWQDIISQHLISQWRELSGHQGKAYLSYPGLPGNYRLPDCPGGFSIDLLRPLQPGRNGIEVSCASPYWKQNLAIQLHVIREVLVLSRTLADETTLKAGDIRFVERDTGELTKGYYTRQEDISGMMTRRTLRAGTVLSPEMIEPPVIIRRGEPVSIRINRPGIHIEMKGIALSKARAGERIRVRNEGSGKIISAEAIKPGVVQVR